MEEGRCVRPGELYQLNQLRFTLETKAPAGVSRPGRIEVRQRVSVAA